MKRVIAFTALSLAICGLLLIPITSAKDPVRRPTNIRATGMLNIVTGVGSEGGQISHGGAFEDQWSMTPNGPLTGVLSGTVTVANGDEYFWSGPVELFPADPELTQIDFTLEVNVNGGTGRFTAATGQLNVLGTAVSTGTPGVYRFSYAGGGYLAY